MNKRLRVPGLLLFALILAVTPALGQGVGYWETVAYNNMAMNSGWMELSVADRDNIFVAGLHQSGALSAQYAWASYNAGDSWQPIYEIEMDASDPCGMMDLMGFIFGIAFTDESHGVITGMGVPNDCKELGMPLCMSCIFQMKAKALYTFDGGETFEEGHVPGDSIFKMLMSATFVTDTVGYAAGSPAYILRTTDGGFGWVQMEIPGGDEELGINQLHFVTPDEGFMATGDADPEEPEGKSSNLTILEASEAQDPYAFYEAILERHLYMNDPVVRLKYREEHAGQGKGMNGIIFHTEDGGISWDPILSANKESFLKVHFNDSDHGWVLADPQEGTSADYFRIYYTTDGGENWDRSEIPEEVPGSQYYTISDIFFIDNDTGFAVGAGGGGMSYKTVILYTEDGGETWESDPFTADGNGRYPLLAVDFSDRKTGYAVGMYLSASRYTGINSIPIADAGEDATVNLGETVQLDGTGSYDPDEDPIDYIWAQPAGAPVMMDDSTIAQPSFEADTLGQLTFELIVTDGEANSEPDQVVITVVEGDDDDDNTIDDDDDNADDDDDDDDDDDGCGGCSIN